MVIKFLIESLIKIDGRIEDINMLLGYERRQDERRGMNIILCADRVLKGKDRISFVD